jgi:hypothetical protein
LKFLVHLHSLDWINLFSWHQLSIHPVAIFDDS